MSKQGIERLRVEQLPPRPLHYHAGPASNMGNKRGREAAAPGVLINSNDRGGAEGAEQSKERRFIR